MNNFRQMKVFQFRIFGLMLALSFVFGNVAIGANTKKASPKATKKMTVLKKKGKKEVKKMYALFDTTLGQIKLELFPDKVPQTVANFVDLAEGNKEFTDPETSKKVKRRFYDGLIFHRVIPDFMIQGGGSQGKWYRGGRGSLLRMSFIQV